MSDERLNLEILGLLLQVAWADGAIEARESAHILERAKASGLDESVVQRLDACLRGEATLPPPDLGYLRSHKDQVMAAVERFVGGDDATDADTETLIDEVRALLGG